MKEKEDLLKHVLASELVLTAQEIDYCACINSEVKALGARIALYPPQTVLTCRKLRHAGVELMEPKPSKHQLWVLLRDVQDNSYWFGAVITQRRNVGVNV